MDPRIRERRIAVRRDEGRRRLRILVMALSVVAVLGGGYGVTRSPLFDVDKVVVEGATRTPVAEVARAAGLDHHPQMADVDAAAAGRGIEHLPWVATAHVTRRWPGTVVVRLLERSPAATLAAAGGGWATVDGSGRVVEIGATSPPGLVPLAGVTAPPVGDTVDDRTRGALSVLEALPAALDARLKGIDVGPDGAIVVHLDAAPPVIFGAPAQVREKLVALSTLLARVDLKGATAIDVRVPTAPVLTHAKP
ncbi:MAG TPA: FtsQ-type POTRA domain-containing protein [Acidimicrobiales bacterium]|nr:FtsQ-type POTRA domain-containing protein [Acidimicrobiales bacterium]